MATWNRSKTQRDSRTNILSDVEPLVPPEFTDIGVTDSIDVAGVTTEPVFFIAGTVLQRADLFDPVLEEPPERFPARSRPASAPIDYRDLDPILDAELIGVEGLTFEILSDGDRWTTHFPVLESDTQVYTDENSKPVTWDDGLIVGQNTTFVISNHTLYGTSYTVGRVVYGREENLQGSPTWSGVILSIPDPNTMEVSITSVGSPESINIESTTQHWYISNDQNLLDNLF